MKNKEMSLSAIWNNVWNDSQPGNYSQLRQYKTEDKIDTLISLGVDFHGKNVLDIGCGEGTALFYLEEKYGITGTGIDISESVIHRNLQNKKVSSRLDFFKGDHKSLDLGDNQFDIVLSWGVVEHFKEYIQALSEARRVLKEDGVLVLIQPNLWSFGVVQEKILKLLGKWRFGEQRDFSYRHLSRVLEGLGYYNLTTYTKVPYKDMYITRFFDKLFKKVFPFWGHYLYIISRKRNLAHDYKESFDLFLSKTDEKEVIADKLKKEIDFSKISACLDIGGGNGSLLTGLCGQHKVLIIEPNRHFVDVLLEKKFRCICAKWEDVELDEKFDLITAAYVTTYLPKEDLSGLIEKMVKYLNPGGKLVILTVDEKEGSWREAHTFFYDLIGLQKVSSTVTLKKIMGTLGATEEKFVTNVYADDIDQMIKILSFDFCKYGKKFDDNVEKLKEWLCQNCTKEAGRGLKLEMVHWMFVIQ